MSTERLLEAHGLALVRGGRMLFEGLDLKVAHGERLHLAGANGSGKTSLLRLVAGLLQPSAGTILRAPLALADEHAALDRELPLAKALAFWRGGQLREAIAAFGLADLERVPVRLLSAGQLKRAALARVMASGAPLWLLDEPLNALDSDGAALLASAIDSQLAAGGAVIAASHQPLPGDWRTVELGQ
ncbi:MAG: heme ABC exporter ATP-binding protein CcmA [Pseudomonadota bacterium]